jgi:hypothetical protein
MVELKERHHLGRRRRKWENNIKTDVREMECVGVDGIDLAQSLHR